MAIQYPLINGNRHDFSSIEVNLNGEIFRGFHSINYSRTRTRTDVRGNHPDPLGKTRGTTEYSGDCELYLAEWNQFINDIGVGYGDYFFTVTASYTAPPAFDPNQDVLLGCTIDSTEVSQSQSGDPLMRKFNLRPVKILFNGIDDAAPPLNGSP